MDKKSANGVQAKSSEAGVQRKQLPYSVETPYGFHLDLDFLKYVDDIEKGNTIKRVHIQRRIKGPPKFSTLPRNFSLPGHGVRPAPKETTAWSGTSTLGPKPKSRVTEVQQIFDFRSELGSTSQSSRGLTNQGYVSPKPRDETSVGSRLDEKSTAELQNRPNLLRASSMPITLQQRKGSDSSSPVLVTPENGSSENMFRASPDVTERRIPQDRTGLHQQITVALKRVRELEEQVKTIPELKAQISALREEREKLLLQLQAQMKARVAAESKDTGTHSQQQGQRPSQELKLALTTQTLETKPGTEKDEGEAKTDKVRPKEAETSKLSEAEIKSEQSSKEQDTLQSSTEHSAQKQSQEVISLRETVEDTKINSCQHVSPEKAKTDEVDSVEELQEKLRILETKLSKATDDLERTSSLLKRQIEENKAKEEKILQLSEGMRVEVCSPEMVERPRRESIDTGTITERVDMSNQETETEPHSTVDQGTDTDKICVEVCFPQPAAESVDQRVDANQVHTQMTEIAVEAVVMTPPRPRANSMERSTETERVITQDQTTETPVAERVNQVTETETGNNHPIRPRTSSVDRGTVTERVGTVDRVTETEAAPRTDQQTETEMVRRLDNNPARHVETHVEQRVEVQEREIVSTEMVVEVEAVVSQTEEVMNESQAIQEASKIVESVVAESLVEVAETKIEQSILEMEKKVDESIVVDSSSVAAKDVEPKVEEKIVESKEESKEPSDEKAEVTEVTETKVGVVDKTVKKQEVEVVRPKVKEPVSADKVVETPKTTAPVRPQRGRRPSNEQPQPAPTQPQPAPVRPRRVSMETQAAQPTPVQKTTPSQEQISTTITTSQPTVPTSSQVQEPPKVTPVPQAKDKVANQEQTPSKPQTKSEVTTRPKSIQSQTSATRRNSKEVKAPQKVSSVTQPTSRTTRQGSQDVPAQGSRRSSGGDAQTQKEGSETQPVRRGSSEAAQRRGSGEGQGSRRDSAETQRKMSSDSPTSPAALGQVVTRLTGLLGEQWAQLGSSGTQQQTVNQQETPSAPKQTAGKKAEPVKGTGTKPAGKATPASAAGKPAGKPAPSKMSSIQSQLVSSLSVLSAFYSPAQKAAAASKQQEQAGLKSIMKKNGVADKPGNKGAKKNLKFVGVNGGYETTSSEESSGDEKSKVEVEEEDSSGPELEKEKEPESEGVQEEAPTAAAAAAAAQSEPEGAAEAEGAEARAETQPEAQAQGVKEESEKGLLDLTPEHEVLEEDGEKVDRGFVDACLYVKDRMEEVSSPDKEMRQVLVVLYQEWFRVSSQKDSKADTVRLYLRQVGMTTPTLLPYVVNLTDGNGNMALHYSVSHSNFSVVKLLLDTGLCETDNVNKAGYTPVMLAALTAAESPDDLEVAEQLLKMGDVNARSRQAGQTALMLAVSHGRVAMVKLLLSCGADVNAQDREGSTALMCACEHGHTHITRLLLETGQCDMSLTDKNGQTALAVAEGASHQDIVDLLKSYEKSTPDLL
ncbi:KN motif and ankyrin repeat domain-containing protein 4 [Boleophthalmus pectinirostris]|uniref:KN motif and ankyrin repeat domain-containing protein 4 n=1 Tax=Boleophthalmus pectinirostris TaxID=150288 RepID=UPI0024312B40|nr:KN motif and ankyrin repeat domain-containing protein 4 [Boleophthalmus pectinirostris]XP_055020813.1 KN motif and ankyrin repeat domain-containing protein 4 [Boleophthalmus pectinirostris]XP_055020814.1 KN motif and ankyrin repeat domain-containing protein 4 [Boleophthalmus pectinirostris]